MGRHGRHGRDGRDGRDILVGPKEFPFSLAPKGSSFLSFGSDAGVLSAPRLRVTREVTVDTGVFDTGVFDNGVFDTGVFGTDVFGAGVFGT